MSAETRQTGAPGRMLVLTYHGVHADRSDPGHYDPRYSVRPERFARQIARLAGLGRAGWLPVSGAELAAPPAPAGQVPVLITFDDSDLSNVETALPILQAHGLGAVFFITRDFIGQRGKISLAGLRTLAEAGMAIGSHGLSHRFLTTLSPTALAVELSVSRDALEQLVGREVALLSLPGGRGKARELAAARAAGYRGVLGSRPGDNRSLRPGEPIERIAVTRGLGQKAFEQVLHWQGPATWALRGRDRALAWPRCLLGDRGYDWLRQALVR